MEWITENQANLLMVLTGAMALGGAIVKLTPTKTDDKWFRTITGFFGKKS